MGHILRSSQTQLELLFFYNFNIFIFHKMKTKTYTWFNFSSFIWRNQSYWINNPTYLKHIIIYGFTISLSTICNYDKVFYFFLSFQVQKKKKMLLIAIVCLQYILLQYSLCSICVDNLYVLYISIYIYIYISSCNKERRVLQKP